MPARSARPLAIVALVLALVAAGCGATAATGPRITVATTLYPLAQAVAAIGGPDVRVVDLAVEGQDPRTLAATPARAAALRGAVLDVEVGGGFQPALEGVATSVPRFTLTPRFGVGDDGPWLDPVTMEAVLPALADALAAVDPAAKDRFANGQRDLYEELVSVSSEYEDALSACPHDQIAAPGSTLADVAHQYRLTLHQLGTTPPAPGSVSAGAQAVAGAGITTVLTLPWVSTATATAVAHQTSVKTRSFDTAEAPPVGGWPRGTTYIGLLDKGLATIAGALGCPSTTDTQ